MNEYESSKDIHVCTHTLTLKHNLYLELPQQTGLLRLQAFLVSFLLFFLQLVSQTFSFSELFLQSIDTTLYITLV